MKIAPLFLLLTVVVSSCGLWKDTGRIADTPSKSAHEKKYSVPVYVYTGPEFSRSSVLSELTAEYGLVETGGSLVLFDSVRELASIPSSSILLVVGADSRIVQPLSRFADERLDVRIITLFPLVEPIEVECFSELVLDNSIPDGLIASEAIVGGRGLNDSDLSLLFLAAVRYAENRDWNQTRIEQLTNEISMAARSAGWLEVPSGWVLSYFIDPATGIRARNHLVLRVVEEK